VLGPFSRPTDLQRAIESIPNGTTRSDSGNGSRSCTKLQPDRRPRRVRSQSGDPDLQGVLEEPFLDAGIDKFIWKLPRRYLDRPLWDEVLGLATEAGPVAHRLASGMHQSIAAPSRAGNNVVADHVLVERRWLAECAVLFGELPAPFVGVRCPLDVLEQREAARKDRTLGQARAQFHQVHAHGIYDLEVDTSTTSAEAGALQINQRLVEGDSPDAFERLRQLRTLSDTLVSDDSG
jgi:chloramphenicol 3-O phosphotransferase